MSLSLLVALFFIVATIYSSVGFGGGSSYLALLLLVNLSASDVRPIALVCNLIVVSVSIVNFHKHDLLPYKKIWSLVLLSIPMAFIGGTVTLDPKAYKLLAGVLLILASLLMLYNRSIQNEQKKISTFSLGAMGGGIGLLSGIIGIGGGIFLAPLLYLSRWQSAKVIAATSSLFIFVNSLAGLAGQFVNGVTFDITKLIYLGLSVFVGALLGNNINIKVLSHSKIRMMTAFLVLFVGLRLLWINLT